MVDQKLYLETLAEYTRSLLSPYDPVAVLSELARRVAEVLELAGAAVSLERGERLEPGCVHDGDAVASLERLQERIQVGPGVTALHSGDAVTVADLATAHGRWPEFCRTAADVGILAVAALPLRLDRRTVGALDLYAGAPHAWSAEELAAATVMGDMATVYLVNAAHLRRQTELAEQLQHALDSRIVIEQAKGVLVARRGLDPDAAFQCIRRHARERNRTLAELAKAVVEHEVEL